MRRAPVAVLVLVLAVAGCGGGGASTKDFQAALDRECAGAIAFNQSLPRRQADEDLSLDAVQKLADDHARASRKRADALDRPDALDAAYTRLTDVLDSSPLRSDDLSRDEAIAYYGRVKVAYAGVGATGCADGVQRGIDQFRSLPTPTPTP